MSKLRNVIGGKCAAVTIAAATALTLIVGAAGNWAGAEGLNVLSDGAEDAGAANAANEADGLDVVTSDGSDKASQLVCPEGVEPVSLAVAQPGSGAKPLAEEVQAGALAGGSYIFDADVTICEPIEVQADTTIELGDATLAFELEGCFHVPAGVKLTIRRASGASELAQVTCREADQLIMNEGTAVLDGIKLAGGAGRCVVNRKGADLTLLKCEVSGCTGTAVKNAKGATAHLVDTTVSGNGCGVESAGRVGVSGRVVVERNEQGDLNIGGTPLLVEDTLADGARMGVAWSGDNGAITEGFAERNEGDDPRKHFSCEGKVVVRDAAGEASLIDGLSYVNERGRADAVDPAEVTDLANSTTGWIPMPSGWYTFSHSVSWEGRGSVDGDVKMIVPDGVGVDWKYGIHVRPGCSLTIYGQDKGTGELHAYRTDDAKDAGIGGNEDESGSAITICGAHVTAEGGTLSAGIGGGYEGDGGVITIYGGVVNATGCPGAAAIGGGCTGSGGTIAIHGGKVTATGKGKPDVYGGTGIGGGHFGECGSIKIDGGTVTAIGKMDCAGIGGGGDDMLLSRIAGGGTIEILGGTVMAKSGGSGAGIGSGGYAPACRTLTIENADVNAQGYNGAAIGTGSNPGGSQGGKITIRNARVTATSVYGAAVGSGKHKNDEFAGNEISILGNSVVDATATGDSEMKKGDGYAMGDATFECNTPSGQLHLDDHLKVTCYDEGYKLVPVAEREGYCKGRDRVKVEPCDHKAAGSFEKRGEHHIKHCYSCCESIEQEHDFKEDGSCRACHYTKPDPAFGDCEWACDGQISLSFPVEVPTEFAERFEGAYMELAIAGKGSRCVKLPLAEAEADGQGRKVFSMALSPIEMAQPVCAIFHYGDDQRIDAWVSLKDCLERDAKRGGQADMVLTRSLANYGHCLQGYLADANGWGIGRDYEEMDLFFDDLLDVKAAGGDLAAHKAKRRVKGSRVAGLDMGVTFGATATVDLYLTPEAGAELSGTATFGGKDVALERMSDGRWHARVEGICARDFDKPLRIEGDCGGAFSVEASVLSYAAGAYGAKGATDAAKSAMASVWQHHKAAVDCAKLRG